MQVLHIGDWPAPFGITLVADLFGALMAVLAGALGFLVTLYSLISMDARRAAFGYYPLQSILLMGVCGAFLTGDLVSALSLAGLPPFSGFFAKLALVQAALALGQYSLVGVALAVGLLTLFSMTKIWAEVFWKTPPGAPAVAGTPPPPLPRKRLMVLLVPVVALTFVTVGMGVLAEPLFTLAIRAADQLLNPVEYITRVLGN